MEKKRSRNCLKIQFGKVLGSIWEGLGTLWAGFGPLLGACCLLFGRSEGYLFKASAQNEFQEAFWMDFGLLLEGFWFWGGFVKVLGGFGRI